MVHSPRGSVHVWKKAKKRRDLFEPIYNNISSISEDGLYRSNAKKRDTMSASNQLLVPPEIEEDLNTYSEKCSDYQTKYAQLFYSRGEFDSVLPDELYNVHGDREGPEVRVPSSESEMRVVNIRLPDLIRRLKLHTCENPDEVRKRIMQDAERRGETPYLNSIQYLNTNHPHWTSDIYEVLQSRHKLRMDSTEKRSSGVRKEPQTKVEKICIAPHGQTKAKIHRTMVKLVEPAFDATTRGCANRDRRSSFCTQNRRNRVQNEGDRCQYLTATGADMYPTPVFFIYCCK